jgi:hypothetical protein
VRASHHFGAVIGERLLGMECSGFSGQALDDDFGVLVY